MNNEWPIVQLGDICTIERGGSPRPIDRFITEDDDGINWIKIGDTDESMYITRTAQKIKPEGMRKSRYVKEGDFLLSNSMSFGRPYILKIDGCIHDGWLVLRDEKCAFDKRFLYYLLSAPSTYRRFQSMAVGGVVNNLNSEMIRSLTVPLPNAEEQKDIADTLDEVERIISISKQQLAKLDELVKSQFVEMFEKYKNDLVSLKSICVKGPQNGFYRKGAEINGTVPVMKMKQLFGNESMSDADDCDLMNLTPTEIDRFLLTPNDLLFGRRSLVVEGAGKCRRVGNITTQAIFESSMLRVTLDATKAKPRYLQCWFDSEAGTNAIAAIRTVTTIAGIKGSDLANIMVPIAPIDEQDAFLSFVEQADKSKFAIQQSIEKLETLKRSLMQQYFG